MGVAHKRQNENRHHQNLKIKKKRKNKSGISFIPLRNAYN